jgi:peptidoglycan-N-acetylglucosamine deacetylase
MFIAKTPKLLQTLMPAYTWSIPTTERVLYLTFDDGPIPEVTPWVLDTLLAFDAKATFFCVGDNVEKHSAIYQRILDEGHSVGNHTFNHLNGWQTDHVVYLNNVRRCARVVKSRLFRPPYGRLMPKQRAFLLRHFQIVMWDVLSGDYDASISPQQCLQNVLDNAQPGSIVLMHDSLKAERNLRFVLPAALEYFAAQGYRFEKMISDEYTVS